MFPKEPAEAEADTNVKPGIAKHISPRTVRVQELIRELKEWGCSAVFIADMLKVTSPTLSHWSSGISVPTEERVAQLEKVYDKIRTGHILPPTRLRRTSEVRASEEERNLDKFSGILRDVEQFVHTGFPGTRQAMLFLRITGVTQSRIQVYLDTHHPIVSGYSRGAAPRGALIKHILELHTLVTHCNVSGYPEYYAVMKDAVLSALLQQYAEATQSKTDNPPLSSTTVPDQLGDVDQVDYRAIPDTVMPGEDSDDA